ncbi:SAM-dependent methyltransferase [Streptomyces sp. NPDC056244]|uniref:SAM-dependent methyltransferase n=1 Tax=Streptomyces sp. NPDC056244 TaxID=3345762 RepID=UPI0035DDF248
MYAFPAAGRTDGHPPVGTDESMMRPTSARVFDCLLGGKDHYPCDTVPARRAMQAAPFLPAAIRRDRAWVRTIVAELAAHGLGQVVDLGCGLPHEQEPFLHDVLAPHRPDGQVLHVDSDPVVAAHMAAALMTSRTPVVTGYLHADITCPPSVLDSPLLAEAIDLTLPVVLVVGAVLHHLTDEQTATVVEEFSRAVCAGSALVVTHWTHDFAQTPMRRTAEILTSAGVATYPRTEMEIAAVLERHWDLVPPGVAAPGFEAGSRPDTSYAAVARKP